MINLLPDESKAAIHAARTNVTLVGYIVILCLAVMFLGAISSAVYFALLDTQANAASVVATNNTKSVAYSTVQAQADALKTSLTNAKTILDQEVDYTKAITGIANAMPAGVVIDTLNLSPTTFGTPITLIAYAKTTASALALKANFQKSPLFSNVSFQSLASSAPGQAGNYPITATLNVTINKGIAL